VRLLVLGPGHPFRGGIARTTTDLAAVLGRRGHEIVFLTPTRQYPNWIYPGGADRDPAACPRLDGSEAVLDPLWPPAWPRARRRAVRADADAWLVPYWTWVWSPMWRFLLGAAVKGPPVVAIVHNPADHDGSALHRLAARLVLQRCRALFTHAEAMAAELRADFPSIPVASHPLPASHPRVLPERARARAGLGLGRTDRVALFLGLIRPYKGVDVLLEAFARLPESSPWRLVVAGEAWGGLGAELEGQLAGLGIEERVRLDLRWIPEEEIPALLAAADVVVLPYRAGSQSAVVPMAMAYGLPVITTAVGGLPEVVKDGVNGLVVQPGSPEALAAAFQRTDAKVLGELAEGVRAAAARFTWDGYAEALEALIRRVA
jgi:glycosyltransferase involved in cell wall biosynthesis